MINSINMRYMFIVLKSNKVLKSVKKKKKQTKKLRVTILFMIIMNIIIFSKYVKDQIISNI